MTLKLKIFGKVSGNHLGNRWYKVHKRLFCARNDLEASTLEMIEARTQYLTWNMKFRATFWSILMSICLSRGGHVTYLGKINLSKRIWLSGCQDPITKLISCNSPLKLAIDFIWISSNEFSEKALIREGCWRILSPFLIVELGLILETEYVPS